MRSIYANNKQSLKAIQRCLSRNGWNLEVMKSDIAGWEVMIQDEGKRIREKLSTMKRTAVVDYILDQLKEE